MNAHPEGQLEDPVFARPGNTPLRPQWVLDQLRKRTAELLAVVSKTLRHSTLATTINLYGHLFSSAKVTMSDTLSTGRPPRSGPPRERPSHLRRPPASAGSPALLPRKSTC